MEPLSLKDTATIAIAVIAAIISVSSVITSVRLEKVRRDAELRRTFTGAVDGLNTARLATRQKKNEMGAAFYSADALDLRQALLEREDHLLSLLLATHEEQPRIGIGFEHLSMGFALMDKGLIGSATHHYRLAIQRETHPFKRVSASRVYGRAIYYGGEFEQGKALMKEAALDFEKFSESADYNTDAMLVEAFHTYRRLVAGAIELDRATDIPDLITAMRRIQARISSSALRDRLDMMAAAELGWDTLPPRPPTGLS